VITFVTTRLLCIEALVRPTRTNPRNLHTVRRVTPSGEHMVYRLLPIAGSDVTASGLWL